MKIQQAAISLSLGCLALGTTIPHDILPEVHQRSSGTTSTISWEPCDLDLSYVGHKDDFECVTIQVPLDYTNCSNHETVQLDLIKYKAMKKPHKGSILYNPGGPGVSGMNTVAARGNELVERSGGHYDIIGFDPRGTGRTLKFDCGGKLRDDEAESLSRREVTESLPLVEDWETFKKTAWEKAGHLDKTCYQEHADIGRFIGTAFVARDMLAILDALDGPDAELNYWGTSYGTVLGQVFVSMFPDRVGRVLLDANLLADSYLTKLALGCSRDTEGSLLRIFEVCVEAGPKVCLLADYAGNNTDAADLMDGLRKSLDDLLGETIDFGTRQRMSGNELTVDIKASLMSHLGHLGKFPNVITLVQATLDSDWDQVINITTTTPGLVDERWAHELDVAPHLGIFCSDSSYRAEDADDMYSMYQAHLADNMFGDAVAMQRLQCARWNFTAAEPVNTELLRNVETKNPVLVVNGIYDPVTPLQHAFEVSSRLRGSRVLVHEGLGHGLATNPSNCTIDAVKSYFTNGTLPKIGTICEPGPNPFEQIAAQQKAAEDAEEKENNKRAKF
ncbi:alpha/beta-hydrolase [Sarocladium strictum]